jgi:hypothetical protein
MFNTVREGIEVYKAELLKLVEDVDWEASKNATRLGKNRVDTTFIEARYERLLAMESCLGLTSLEVQQLKADYKAPRTLDDVYEIVHRRISSS